MAGFPGGSGEKKLPANAGDTGLIHGSQGPLEKEMSTHSSILAWKIPWTGAWWGYSPRGFRRVTQASGTKQLQY